MEANQLKLETRIENEVIDKIRVLFDAHSLYMDYFTSIKDSQARIEENIGFITRRSTETFMKALENEREIRLLRQEDPPGGSRHIRPQGASAKIWQKINRHPSLSLYRISQQVWIVPCAM